MGRKTQRFFRYLWRANAVVIFAAACAVLLLMGPLFLRGILLDLRHPQDSGVPVVHQPEPGQRPLTLGAFSLVDGTNTARAELSVTRSEIGFGSSGEYSETRNILWVDLNNGAARWLLPNHKQVVTYHADVAPTTQSGTSFPVAGLFLFKPSGSATDLAAGQLVVVSPNGERQQQIASGVQKVESWILKGSLELVVIYRGSDRYRLAAIDANTLKKRYDADLRLPSVD